MPENLENNDPNIESQDTQIPDVPDTGGQPQGEPDNGGQPAAEPQQAQQNGSFNQNIPYSRFSEVISERNDLRNKLAQLQSSLQQVAPDAQVNQPLQANSAPELQEPQREQFANDVDYYKAVAAQTAQELLRQQQLQEQQNQKLKSFEQDQINYQAKMAEVAASNKYADFVPTVQNGILNAITDQSVNQAVFRHPNGPDIAYHLAKNPALAVEIANMDTGSALFKIGEIAAKIPGSNGQPSKTPGMPPPIDPIGGGRPNAVPTKYDDGISQEQFEKMYPVDFY